MNTCKKTEALFPLGMVVMTHGAEALLTDTGTSALQILARHQFGDWGDLCEEDEQTNRDALPFGERILSAYKLEGGQKLWVITEADSIVPHF